MKVLISDKLSPKGVEILQQEKGLETDNRPGLSREELLEIINEYDALLIRSNTKVDAAVIERADRLKVVGRAGIGVDNVDVKKATAKGIVVMNTPGGNTITTAEHTFSMMMALARSVPQADTSLKNGKWEKKRFMGVELNGKILGIIGLGRIGREIARRALKFSMRVLAYDPMLEDAEPGMEMVDLDELMMKSDFITVHTPITDKTRHIIGQAAIAKMKRGVRILNCARGGIIDESALNDALKSGKVAGAALDVFEDEPPLKDNPLLRDERVITTPHLGASTREAQENVSKDIAQQIVDMLIRGVIVNAINVPTLSKEALDVLRPYLELAELLGRYSSQLIDGSALTMDVTIAGQGLIGHIEPLVNAVRIGYLKAIYAENKVSIVNASAYFQELGIHIREIHHYEDEDYTNLIRVGVQTDNQKREVAGTIIAKRWTRITAIDRFKLEITPSNYTLVIFNDDKPGIIGNIGALLGENGINIAGMQFGRVRRGEDAIITLNIDAPVSDKTLQRIKGLPDISSAYLVRN